MAIRRRVSRGWACTSVSAGTHGSRAVLCKDGWMVRGVGVFFVFGIDALAAACSECPRWRERCRVLPECNGSDVAG